MLRRCYAPAHDKFAIYGGRGITVCAAWQQDFWAFVRDMGERPEGKTLDRIDVNGNYEPGNCRWATPREQANNQRNTKRLRVGGDVLSVSDACAKLKLSKEAAKKGAALGLEPYKSVAYAAVVRALWKKQDKGERVDWGKAVLYVPQAIEKLSLSPV